MESANSSNVVNNFENEIKVLSDLTTKTDILVKEAFEMRVKSAQLACSLAVLQTPELDKAAKELADKIMQAERHSSEIDKAESRTVELQRKLTELNAACETTH